MEPKDKKKKPITPEKALERLASLCARSEQCTADLSEKLRKMEIAPADVEDILARLRELKFLDDSRYARALARDKVRFAGWGRMKIRQQLMVKRIPASEIEAALAEIDPQDYKEALIRVAKAKVKMLDLKEFDHRTKLLKHLMSRGFESNLAVRMVQEIVKRLPEEDSPECDELS